MGQEVLPKDDVMFRMIFGNPKHSRILIHFLNCVIKPASPIKSVEIKKTELTPEYAMQKGVRLDIVAVTDGGEILNVEMQRKDEKNIAARALFYWSQLFAGQLEVGEKYHQLKRTISINILDFDLFKNDERYWRKGYLKDDVSNEKFTDLLEMHFLELGKMRQVEDKSPVTFWIEFFKNPYSEKIASLCKFVPEIQEAKAVFEKAKSDPEAQELMRIREKGLRDYYNDISCAKEEGIAIGEEKGEQKKARETAVKLLAMGLRLEQIATATGLSIDEIVRLGNEK
ncbi:MAG: Rpn family recombination-promoting nuclease/putative transposase [Holosporaceae bacterium]|jgi:predicted transposase/invertase (TIGR01784 family)|nr:Rpn family recombination-promoting nuclease/putative transposase [Holosporaceae bacterium]